MPVVITFEKVNFILSVGCNNKNKLKVTLKYTLTKVTFNNLTLVQLLQPAVNFWV